MDRLLATTVATTHVLHLVWGDDDVVVVIIVVVVVVLGRLEQFESLKMSTGGAKWRYGIKGLSGNGQRTFPMDSHRRSCL